MTTPSQPLGSGIAPEFRLGTPEHATLITEGRHPGVRDALQWLAFSHLPVRLQKFSQMFYVAAMDLIQEVRTDSPELTTALNTMIAAKDSAMRAGIKHETGRAGSVPRPQTITDPPKIEETHTPGTMNRVRKALGEDFGLDNDEVSSAISAMQNRGILFRELA
jgi:hypothetical protein